MACQSLRTRVFCKKSGVRSGILPRYGISTDLLHQLCFFTDKCNLLSMPLGMFCAGYFTYQAPTKISLPEVFSLHE